MNARGPHSRRTFVYRIAYATVLVLGVCSGFFFALLRRARAAGPPPDTPGEGERRRRWGMAIDLDRCTGCGACVTACRVENNIACAGPDARMEGADILWMNLLSMPAGRTAAAPEEDAAQQPLPVPCMHCDDPPCVKVCPVGATYLSGEGAVAQISDRCIGCRFCEVACPYGVRFFNWTAPQWPTSQLSSLNPDVGTRPAGVVEKCSFCQHRIRRVKEDARLDGREVTDALVQQLPACAEACPAEAIVFGDLEDRSSRVSEAARSPRAFRLLEHLGTQPKVVYLSRKHGA